MRRRRLVLAVGPSVGHLPVEDGRDDADLHSRSRQIRNPTGRGWAVQKRPCEDGAATPGGRGGGTMRRTSPTAGSSADANRAPDLNTSIWRRPFADRSAASAGRKRRRRLLPRRIINGAPPLHPGPHPAPGAVKASLPRLMISLFACYSAPDSRLSLLRSDVSLRVSSGFFSLPRLNLERGQDASTRFVAADRRLSPVLWPSRSVDLTLELSLGSGTRLERT